MAKLIPILGAAIAALVIGGGAGWYFAQSSAPKQVVVAAEQPKYVEYTIADRIVNLADPGARRYLKVSMVLQVAKQSGTGAQAAPASGTIQLTSWDMSGGDTVEAAGKTTTSAAAGFPNAPQVYDAITTVLSSKRSDEVMSTEGRDRLREELRVAINRVLPKDEQVVKVFFTDFIIQ